MRRPCLWLHFLAEDTLEQEEEGSCQQAAYGKGHQPGDNDIADHAQIDSPDPTRQPHTHHRADRNLGGRYRQTGLGGEHNVIANGAIAVTGGNIDPNGTTYTSNTGALTFTGAVDLDSGGIITLTSGGGAGDDITITGAVEDADSADTLVLQQWRASVVCKIAVGTLNARRRPAVNVCPAQ